MFSIFIYENMIKTVNYQLFAEKHIQEINIGQGITPLPYTIIMQSQVFYYFYNNSIPYQKGYLQQKLLYY